MKKMVVSLTLIALFLSLASAGAAQGTLEHWSDSFNDMSKVSQLNNVVVDTAAGRVKLAVASTTATIIQDDFQASDGSPPDPTKWVVLSGSPTIQSNSLRMRTTGQDPPGGFDAVETHACFMSPVTATFDVCPTGFGQNYFAFVNEACGGAKLGFQNFYETLAVYNYLEGRYVWLGPAIYGWHSIRIALTGTVLDFYVDGALKYTCDVGVNTIKLVLTPLSYGRYSPSGYYAYYDNVRIEGYTYAYAGSGSITSTPIQPKSILRWGVLSATETEPAGTSITYDILDGYGNPIPGYTALPEGADLSGIPVDTYRYIMIRANLATGRPCCTPVLDGWAVSYFVPIHATVDVKPDTLNKASNSDKNAVTVYIELPSGFDVNAIDVSTVTLRTARGSAPAQPSPTVVGDYDGDGVPDRMVKFDREAVKAIVDVGEKVEIRISGKIAGEVFEGSDDIRVIAQGKN